MNAKYKANILCLLISVALLFSLTGISLADEYEGLKGVKSAKAVFDVRVGNPKVAAVHLDLIRETFKELNLTIKSKKPSLVVIFMGPAVKLVSKNREGFTPEEREQLDAVARIISDMAKEGIKLEICMAAVRLLGVDSASILPEIKQVGSGWTSAIGYQLKGYALISDF
jgi:intracellular sulfur oxidation DsrE/DsrF family protein